MFARLIRRALPFILVCCFLLQGVLSLLQKSATYDEAVLLASGAHFLRTCDTGPNAENPPLLKAVHALPTRFMRIRFPPMPPTLSYSYSMAEEIEWGRAFLFEKNDARRILMPGRVMALLFVAGCGLLAFFVIRRRWGPLQATVFLILFCFSPNLLAHARLTTPDAGAACLMFLAALLAFETFVSGRYRVALFAGLLTGLALVAKFTGTLIIPIVCLQALMFGLARRGAHRARRTVLALLVLGATALAVVHVFYPAGPRFVSLAGLHCRSPLLGRLARLPLLGGLPLPLPHGFLRGLDIVAHNNQPGFPNYFLGRFHPGGGSWWYFYVVVLALKLPLPALVLYAAALFLFARDSNRNLPHGGMLAIGPVVILLNFSLLCYRQLGIRYVLPALPFFFLGAALIVGKCATRSRAWQRACILALCCQILSGLAAFPHYLPYFNVFAGSRDRGTRLLFGADWGQDLPGLARWHRKSGYPPLGLDYYGTADPSYYGGFQPYYAPSNRYLAVSVSQFLIHPENAQLMHLSKQPPVAVIGHTIKVYDLRKVPPLPP